MIDEVDSDGADGREMNGDEKSMLLMTWVKA